MRQTDLKLRLYPKLHFLVYAAKLGILSLLFSYIYRLAMYSYTDNTERALDRGINVKSGENRDSESEVHAPHESHAEITPLSIPPSQSTPLILLWNNYQETGSHVYNTIFKRITSGQCKTTCRITQDKSRQNESSAIVFHMPDLHWEGYNFPQYRNPGQPWVLMTYESGNSIRQRSFYKGKYPIFDGRQLAGVINRTMTLREDSDIVVRCVLYTDMIK